jgi:hypothetical protein
MDVNRQWKKEDITFTGIYALSNATSRSPYAAEELSIKSLLSL